MKCEYNTREMLKITGLSMPSLSIWLEKGWILPQWVKTGVGRIFNRDDIYQIAMMCDLIAFGLSRKRSAVIAKENRGNRDRVIKLKIELSELEF